MTGKAQKTTLMDLARMSRILQQWNTDPYTVSLADVNYALGNVGIARFEDMTPALWKKLAMILAFANVLHETQDYFERLKQARRVCFEKFFLEQHDALEAFVQQMSWEEDQFDFRPHKPPHELETFRAQRRACYTQFFERRERLIVEENKKYQEFCVDTAKKLGVLHKELPKFASVHSEDNIKESLDMLQTMVF